MAATMVCANTVRRISTKARKYCKPRILEDMAATVICANTVSRMTTKARENCKTRTLEDAGELAHWL